MGNLHAKERAAQSHRTYRSPFRHPKVCLPALHDVVRGSGRSSVSPPGAGEGRPVEVPWNKAECMEPDGMHVTPPDWFVNSKAGDVIHVKGSNKITKEVEQKLGYKNTDYERLSGDDMFGSKVGERFNRGGRLKKINLR